MLNVVDLMQQKNPLFQLSELKNKKFSIKQNKNDIFQKRNLHSIFVYYQLLNDKQSPVVHEDH